MKVFECLCGNVPQGRCSKVTIGNGSMCKVYWVECECGMRTTHFEDYDITGERCMLSAIRIWNRDRELVR